EAKARREIMQSSYSAIAAWLRVHVQRGDMRSHDSEAVAAVILGSIAMFRVFEALWGERTVPVDDERFIRAWHELVTRGLGVGPAPSSPARQKCRVRSAPRRQNRR